MAGTQHKGVPGMTPAQEAARLANLEKAKATPEAESGVGAYEAPDEGLTPTHAAMQHVARNADKRHDKTGLQKNMRSFFIKKPDAFMAQLNVLDEKTANLKSADGREGDEVEMDRGSKRALEHCESLLREIAKEAEREAEVARPQFRCPRCNLVGVLPVKV
jgi:hypothetical protein